MIDRVERISADEALRRGYRWARIGWNHKENIPLIAPIRMLKPFYVNGFLVADLEKVNLLVNPPCPEPTADIPMEVLPK